MSKIDFYRYLDDPEPLEIETIPDNSLLPRNVYIADFQSASILSDEVKLKNDQNIYTHTVLDRILPRGLEEGMLTLLHTPESSRFYLPLYVELILRNYKKRSIYFIDCDNLFPVYQIIETAVARGVSDPHDPLQKVQLSRCFNYHQMTELVNQHLEPAITELMEWKENDFVPLIIVSGISSLHFSQEAAEYLKYDKKPPWWCVFELQQSLQILKNLSMKYQLPILLTTASFSPQSLKALGGTFLMHTAQIVVKLEETGEGVYGSLIKHPNYSSQRVLLQKPVTSGGESYLPLQNYLNQNIKTKKRLSKKTQFPQKKLKKFAKLARISSHKQSDLLSFLV
ncbi:MAG: hypothetical protein HeimC3_09690 [Candidatus Heimdallarchaeota archaeon LC_3]|nr:MAG: hypothetical protein HeimC3_09690 [Candidatus Heimdallarchaeota archaeon LC_3]